MKATINKTSKLTAVNGSTGVAHGVMVKRITKVEFGYVVDIVRTVVVRSYECATLEEAKSVQANIMNIKAFLNYINYSTVCPSRIHPMRWNAMITWAKKMGYIS